LQNGAVENQRGQKKTPTSTGERGKLSTIIRKTPQKKRTLMTKKRLLNKEDKGKKKKQGSD